jgi:hypothetical protein
MDLKEKWIKEWTLEQLLNKLRHDGMGFQVDRIPEEEMVHNANLIQKEIESRYITKEEYEKALEEVVKTGIRESVKILNKWLDDRSKLNTKYKNNS